MDLFEQEHENQSSFWRCMRDICKQSGYAQVFDILLL